MWWNDRGEDLNVEHGRETVDWYMLEILKRHGVKGTNCNYADVSVYGVMNTVMPSLESVDLA